jgi:hypothetical protein
MTKKAPPSRRHLVTAAIVRTAWTRIAGTGTILAEGMRPRRRRSLAAVMAMTAVALVLPTAAAAAETRTPVTQMGPNPCTGEAFVAEGTFTSRLVFTVGADGRLHETFQFNLHATTAKGVATGVKYVVQEQFHEGTNADADAMPSTQHHIYKQRYVRSGEAGELFEEDDFYVWFHIHFTINSSGVPTSMKLEFSDEACQ